MTPNGIKVIWPVLENNKHLNLVGFYIIWFENIFMQTLNSFVFTKRANDLHAELKYSPNK